MAAYWCKTYAMTKRYKSTSPIFRAARCAVLMVSSLGILVSHSFLTLWREWQVTVHECHNSKLHFYGECGDLQLVCFRAIIACFCMMPLALPQTCMSLVSSVFL